MVCTGYGFDFQFYHVVCHWMNKATTVWRARAGSQETGPPLQTFQGHSESRLAMV